MKNDFVIVGGGIAALELGAMLSRDGRRVVVLERAAKVGGRARVWEKDGFLVDLGIHLVRFGRHSAISAVCRHLGHELAYSPLGTSYVVDDDGQVKVFPTSPASFLSTDLFSHRDRLRVFRLIGGLIRGRGTAGLRRTTVEDWLAMSGIKEGGLKRYLHLVTASMLVCPFLERASAGELLLNLRKVILTRTPALYPRNGWAPIFELFVRSIQARGEIRCQARVSRVMVEHGQVRGVVLDGGEEMEAENVVVNVPIQQAIDLFDEGVFDRDQASRYRDQRPTAGLVIDYGLGHRISEDSGLWYFYRPMSFGLFTSNHSPVVSPPGKQLFSIMQPTWVADMKDKEKARMLTDEVERMVFRRFPGFQEAVEWRRVSHLAMVDGVELNVHQLREDRIPHRYSPVEGLYFVGDSTGARGAGGDVGHESAIECYTAITGRSP